MGYEKPLYKPEALNLFYVRRQATSKNVHFLYKNENKKESIEMMAKFLKVSTVYHCGCTDSIFF